MTGRDTGAEPRTRGAYGKVPPWWGPALRKSPNRFDALQVAIALASHANKRGLAWPSRDTIARELGISVVAVSRAIASLIEAGIIDRHRRQRNSSVYRVHLDVSATDTSKSLPDVSAVDTSRPVLDMPAADTSSLDVSDADTSKPLDVSIPGRLDVPVAETQTDQLNSTYVRRENREDEDASRTSCATKLKALGLRSSQATEAVSEHLAVAQAWADVGVDGVPKTGIDNPVAFIVAAIRRDEPPQRSTQPPSRYRDYTGAGARPSLYAVPTSRGAA